LERRRSTDTYSGSYQDIPDSGLTSGLTYGVNSQMGAQVLAEKTISLKVRGPIVINLDLRRMTLFLRTTARLRLRRRRTLSLLMTTLLVRLTASVSLSRPTLVLVLCLPRWSDSGLGIRALQTAMFDRNVSPAISRPFQVSIHLV
jgi:hypothetical protein